MLGENYKLGKNCWVKIKLGENCNLGDSGAAKQKTLHF